MENEENVARVKELFQQGYQVLYSEGQFDSVLEHAEKAGAAEAVSAILVGIIDSMIRDAGEMDMNILFNTAVLLMADILESLQELGVEASEEDGNTIISKTIQGVLQNNPEFAEQVMSDPGTQEMMNTQAPQGQPQPQGVL